MIAGLALLVASALILGIVLGIASVVRIVMRKIRRPR